ncbi:MAG TPA: hypothetical protein VIS10_16545 [Anaerolineales bacterium]
MNDVTPSTACRGRRELRARPKHFPRLILIGRRTAFHPSAGNANR